jgi:hypothetical protein
LSSPLPPKKGDHLYLVDDLGQYHLEVAGNVGFRFFAQLILGRLSRIEKSMTQAHAFKVAEFHSCAGRGYAANVNG